MASPRDSAGLIASLALGPHISKSIPFNSVGIWMTLHYDTDTSKHWPMDQIQSIGKAALKYSMGLPLLLALALQRGTLGSHIFLEIQVQSLLGRRTTATTAQGMSLCRVSARNSISTTGHSAPAGTGTAFPRRSGLQFGDRHCTRCWGHGKSA